MGQGRKYKLSAIEDKLLLILVFYRSYLTDELMGYIFGLHPSNACRMRIKMEPLVEKAADSSLIRIIVEHVISRMKKYQVLAQLYRHKIMDYNQRFRNIAALINFRLAASAI